LEDGQPVSIDTRKAIAVLAVLAVEGRPVRRDTLAGLLWPESTQERARASLRRTLSALRSAIGADGVSADREVVGLDLAPDVVDVVQFELLSTTAPTEALALYRGPFLEGFSVPDAPDFEDWQRGETDRLRLRADSLLDHLYESADPIVAADLARRRLALDALNEAAGRQAMTALGASGDRAGAVAVYRDLVRRLDDALGVEPLADTTAVYEAVRRGGQKATEPPPRPVPVSVHTSTLIGRASELTALTTSAENGGFIVVTGEPGIGRTRLIEDWATSLDETIVLRCHAGEQNLPYAPFYRWLTDTSDTSQIRLFEQLAGALPLGARGVLVMDDLDLADAGTMAFLTYVLHRRDRFEWTVVATWGADQVGTDDACWDLLVEGRREGWATELQLSRLAPDDIAELVRSIGNVAPDVVTEIVERAEGLPLLAVEYMRLDPGSDVIPPAIQDLMRSRLASVSALARQVVGALAVIDRPADDHLLRSVAGRTDAEIGTAVMELLDAGIVRGEGPVGLTHSLLGAVALAELPTARLRALHERAGEALPPAEAASHLATAGHPKRAADLHVRAAEDARQAHATGAALHHLRAALTLGRVDDSAVQRKIGDLESIEGRYEAARRAYEISAARSLGVELAGVELRLTRLALRSGDGRLAASHLDSAEAELATVHPDSAEAELSTSGDDPARLPVELAIVRVLVAAAQDSDATDAAVTAVEVARELDDPAMEAAAESAAALVAYRQDQLDRATAHAQRATRLSELAAAPLVEAAAANLLGLVQARQGQHADAVGSFDRAREILDRHGDVHRLAAVHANMADALHMSDRDDEARAHQLESARLFSEVSGSPSDGRADLWFLTAW
jgi:DNA-binding SARP family transcriptional activator/tetratricopeptide (TPR) repeat protein